MRNASRFTLNAAVLVALLSITATDRTPAQQDQAPLLRTTTRLVQLNAVVLDKQNHPVTGLAKDDFRVYDNGIEQSIAHFTAGMGAAPSQPHEQAPLVIDNRQVSGESSRAVTAIVMDEQIFDSLHVQDVCTGGDPNDPCTTMRQMRLQVLDFLTKLPPGELVGIYALRAAGVIIIHDFTDDPASLAAAAKSLSNEGLKGKPVADLASPNVRALVRWTQNAPLHGAGPANQVSADPDRLLTSYGFQAVMKHMQGIPGRKNLVWVSSMLPLQTTGFSIPQMLAARDQNLAGNSRSGVSSPNFPDPRNQYSEIRAFGRTLADSNIAVYPFDAYGLMSFDMSGRGIGSIVDHYPQWAAADIIASESGGKALVGRNRLSDDLQQIVASGDHAYQIEYYPGEKAWDGKFHKVELRLTPEHKGLTLLCRKGYYAADTPLAPSYENFREAARSPVESLGIGLTLNVPSNPLEWGPTQVVLKVNVDDIQFRHSGDREHANFAVSFAQIGKDGKILEGVNDNVALALQPDTYAGAEQQGWFYTKELVVSGMAAKLRVVVRDRATGATGTVSVPVHTFSLKNVKSQ